MIKTLSRTNIQVKYLALFVNLLILRTVIPYLEYLFAAFALLSFPMLYAERKNIMSELQRTNKHIKVLASYLAITLIFLFSFLITRYYTFILIREFVIAIFFLFYLFFSLIHLKSQNQLVQYVDSFKKQFVIITSFAAILGIVKFAFDVLGIQFSFLLANELYPIGTSLKADHNFFSLSILIGFVFVLDMLSRKSKNKLWYNLMLTLYLVNVLFSSSRRGIVLLLLLNLFIFSLLVFDKRKHQVLIRNIKIYFILVISVILVSLAGLYFRGNHDKAANFTFKYQIASILNNYRSLLNREVDISDSYQLLWKSDFRSDRRINNERKKNTNSKARVVKDPILNAQTQTIYHMELIPGWQQWMSLRTEKVHTDSFELLRIEGFYPSANLYRFIKIDTLIPFLYVSMNIKVEKWNKLERVELRWNNNKEIKNIPEKINDNKWHQFKFKSPIDSASKVRFVLKFAGKNIHDYGGVLLNNLTLSIHPIKDVNNEEILYKLDQLNVPERIPVDTKHEVLNIDTVSWKTRGNVIIDTLPGIASIVLYTYSDSLSGSVYKDIIISRSQYWEFSSKVSVFHAAKNLRIDINNLSSKSYIKGVFPLNSKEPDSFYSWKKLRAYFYAEKGDTVRISLKLYNDTISQLVFWKQVTLKSYNIEDDKVFNDTLKNIDIQAIFNQIEIKKLALAEQNKKLEDYFISPRIDRWKYALELFEDYTIPEKVFGSGFDYLQKFRKEFSEAKEFDYPHNVFLSVLLYSGIMGLLVFLWLICDSCKYYLTSKLYILFVAYLLILSFVLFSSDSIFELPLLTGFIVIPYIYKIVSLKTNSQQNSI